LHPLCEYYDESRPSKNGAVFFCSLEFLQIPAIEYNTTQQAKSWAVTFPEKLDGNE